MADATPRIVQSQTADGASVQAFGSWTSAQFAYTGAWARLAQGLSAVGTQSAVPWDIRTLDQLDHVGAEVLWDHWGRKWPSQLIASPTQRAILQRVAEFAVQTPPARKPTWMQRYEALGSGLLHLLDHLRGFLILVGQLVIDLSRLARAPRRGPWRDVSGHLYRIGATALPITALVGSLIGVVLAYLTAQQLKQFGADAFIVNILGVSLIRELGPMLAAILIAGRSGSAITAQIGVMRVTEELDAMRVMGISHSWRLVMPRAIALALAMPLISVWTTLAALAGGILSADLALGITPSYFINNLPAVVQYENLLLATLKSIVFGVLIALIGCHYGLRIEPNTQSLGEGTTASVVTSITAVILVDALFAIVFSHVGI